jgi:hypothetical protein
MSAGLLTYYKYLFYEKTSAPENSGAPDLIWARKVACLRPSEDPCVSECHPDDRFQLHQD